MAAAERYAAAALIRTAGGQRHILRGLAAAIPDTKEILKLPYSA